LGLRRVGKLAFGLVRRRGWAKGGIATVPERADLAAGSPWLARANAQGKMATMLSTDRQGRRVLRPHQRCSRSRDEAPAIVGVIMKINGNAMVA
jgi:hypothetical protein